MVVDDQIRQFARDESRVYRKGEVLEGADAAGFSVVGPDTEGRDLYFVDGSSVFDSTGAMLPGSDPGSFRHLPDSRYSLDRKQVYYRHHVLEGADASTFSLVEDPTSTFGNLAKDRQAVWYSGRWISGADGGTFRRLTEVTVGYPKAIRSQTTAPFYVDAADTYLFGEPLGTGPASTVRQLSYSPDGTYFAVDDGVVHCHVWDRKTCCSRLVGFRPDETSYLEQGYAASANGGVYHLDRRLEGADGATFEVVEHYESREIPLGRDAGAYYWMNHPVPPERLPADREPPVLGLSSDEEEGTVPLYYTKYGVDSYFDLLEIPEPPRCRWVAED